MRWEELQSTLEKEFPEEFEVKGQDRPSPETVLEWVRKYPDALERLKQLRVQQAVPNRLVQGVAFARTSQSWPASVVPKMGVATGADINGLFGWLMALLVVAVMSHCVSFAFAD